jgi:hypothetical protein
MNALMFLLAERLVFNLEDTFQNKWDWEKMGVYAFHECFINGESFKIFFRSESQKITLSLNIHHLEMPWSIEVLILNGNETVILNSLIKPKENKDVAYEVNHGLLNDPNGLGNELAKEIAEDLLNYIKKAV